MVFSSFVFLLVFLPLCLLGYYLINPRFRNVFLLIASVLFYAWGEPKFIYVMLGSILVNWLFGLGADRFRKNKTAGRVLIALMVLFNVSIFFVYKYLNFTIRNINSLFGSSLPLTNFVLPIGISFYTFQAMSYVIDVYREKGQVQKNPLNVALYTMFFPQLIAGPIVRYETVADEIKNRKETLSDFAEGIKRFIIGLSKKVIISNTVAVAADMAFNTADYSELTVLMAWLGAVCYTLQIFFDFSGYSDMAIGLGRMFGFHFNENFNYPYCSLTVSEFWRRWHISLGSWFRDYVYFPLGGSRVSTKKRLIFNLFVVWMLTGIWHGASWNFVFWGFMYFVLLTFEKLTGIEKKLNCSWKRALYRVFTLFCVMMGWVVFRAPGLKMGAKYELAMFGIYGNKLYDLSSLYWVGEYLVIIITAAAFSIPVIPWIKGKLKNAAAKNIYAVIETAVLAAFLTASISFISITAYDPFIYFNF